MNNTLIVSKSVEQTAEGLRIKRPKNGKPRKFRIGQSALAALRLQQDQQNECRRLCGPDYKNNLVFSQRRIVSLASPGFTNDHPTDTKSWNRERLHSLRHTHASGLLSKGVPLPTVSARLGHADVNITARIYSHALPDDDTRAADTWDTIVKGPVQ